MRFSRSRPGRRLLAVEFDQLPVTYVRHRDGSEVGAERLGDELGDVLAVMERADHDAQVGDAAMLGGEKQWPLTVRSGIVAFGDDGDAKTVCGADVACHVAGLILRLPGTAAAGDAVVEDAADVEAHGRSLGRGAGRRPSHLIRRPGSPNAPDAAALRGIPAIGPGVSGAIRG